MKKIIFLPLVMLFFISQLSAQTKEDYLLKSKKQKTAAWVLLGGGTTLLAVGGIIGIQGFSKLLNGQIEKAGNNIGLAGILNITGGAAMLGSIPLFIASSKNKRKAMTISFSPQPSPALLQHITGTTFIPSISLKFGL